MAAIIQPLASTLRVLEWDDLPASVRTISDNFNPLADGILMLHQRQVAALKASIIAIPKGRRTGITFGTMLDKTLVAAARKSAGGDNVYYIGDTKEKGLEAIGYCAKFARVIARAQGEVSLAWRSSFRRPGRRWQDQAHHGVPHPVCKRLSGVRPVQPASEHPRPAGACRHRRGGLPPGCAGRAGRGHCTSDLGRSDHHHQFA